MSIGNPVTLTGNVATKNISVIATASQTTFTVAGGYRVNQIDVYRNGVRLVDGSDFLARDGSTVYLLNAASANDVLEFQIFEDFSIADTFNPNSSNLTLSGNLTVGGNFNPPNVNTGQISASGLSLTGVVTASSFVGSGAGLTGISQGIGIQSGGNLIGYGVTTLNFIGVGNTFLYNSTTKTVDVSISGNAGAGGTWQANATGIHTTKNVGIATTTASSSKALYVNGATEVVGALDARENVTFLKNLSVSGGISTLSNLNVAGVGTFNNVIIGAAQTTLYVNGNTRIAGILTVGTSSVTLDGSNNKVNVGASATFSSTEFTLGATRISTAGVIATQANITGVVTTSAGTLGSNGNGTRTVQAGGSPSGGVDGDIYYIY